MFLNFRAIHYGTKCFRDKILIYIYLHVPLRLKLSTYTCLSYDMTWFQTRKLRHVQQSGMYGFLVKLIFMLTCNFLFVLLHALFCATYVHLWYGFSMC